VGNDQRSIRSDTGQLKRSIHVAIDKIGKPPRFRIHPRAIGWDAGMSSGSSTVYATWRRSNMCCQWECVETGEIVTDVMFMNYENELEKLPESFRFMLLQEQLQKQRCTHPNKIETTTFAELPGSSWICADCNYHSQSPRKKEMTDTEMSKWVDSELTKLAAARAQPKDAIMDEVDKILEDFGCLTQI